MNPAQNQISNGWEVQHALTIWLECKSRSRWNLTLSVFIWQYRLYGGQHKILRNFRCRMGSFVCPALIAWVFIQTSNSSQKFRSVWASLSCEINSKHTIKCRKRFELVTVEPFSRRAGVKKQAMRWNSKSICLRLFVLRRWVGRQTINSP